MPDESRRNQEPDQPPPSGATDNDAFDAAVRSMEHQKEAVGSHMPENPDYEAEMEERLRRFEHRVKKAKSNEAGRALRTEEATKPDVESSRQLGVGLSIAYAIIGMPVVGYGLGYVLDKGNEVKVWTSWTALGGCVLGLVYAVFVLNRESKRR
ncbi:MAG: hypothetical protein KIS66_13020 [Fimbriimonadaceae bacterium]|nr:hypothetical protein [Fimbriimonadaceae bacterium]